MDALERMALDLENAQIERKKRSGERYWAKFYEDNVEQTIRVTIDTLRKESHTWPKNYKEQ